MLDIAVKVPVGCEDGEAQPVGDGANEQVNRRAGNTATAAVVKQPGGVLIIGGLERKIVEGGQVFAERLEGGLVWDAGEDFLPDGTDEHGPAFADQVGPLLDKPALLRGEVCGRAA